MDEYKCTRNQAFTPGLSGQFIRFDMGNGMMAWIVRRELLESYGLNGHYDACQSFSVAYCAVGQDTMSGIKRFFFLAVLLTEQTCCCK